MGINPGHKALGGRFFISGGTIDLTGQKEVINQFGAKGKVQILRVKIIVFNGVSRLENDGVFESFDRVQCLQLHLQGKGRRESLQVVFRGMTAFRLQEKLVRILVGKGPEFVFNTGTVAGTLPVNHAGKKRRTVESAAQNGMNLLIGVQKVAVHLRDIGLNSRGNIQEGEALRRRVPGLLLQTRDIYRTEIDAGRGPGLHPGDRNPKGAELVRDSVRGFLSDSATFERVLADVHFPVEEGSGGQNNGFSLENCPCNCTNARNFLILKEEIRGKIGVNT